MAGFTHKNLKNDVEDSAVEFGFSPDLESRFARAALETDRLGISYQRLAPNVRGPFGHHHREQEEIYVILGGSGRAKLDDEIVELRRFDALRVAPEVTRQFEAGPDGLELLAFGGGAGGTQDAEVLPGWWSE
jgi:mannose-6-phosphate isomerase-like protein (cupin superfamily)